jgi:hypothetical protein
MTFEFTIAAELERHLWQNSGWKFMIEVPLRPPAGPRTGTVIEGDARQQKTREVGFAPVVGFGQLGSQPYHFIQQIFVVHFLDGFDGRQ